MNGAFIALGTFDGVHRGHQTMLADLTDLSTVYRIPSLVLFFPVPPRAALSGNTVMSMITLPEERAALISACGVDRVSQIEFTGRISSMGHEEFFSDVLLSRYRMKGLLVGKDFAFGRNRAGHIDYMRRACSEAGIPLFVHPFVKEGGHKISSSVIRGLLREGRVEEASRLLGRRYAISGKVVRGEGLGRKLGFPTANLDCGTLKILPRGVFAVNARLGERSFRAVANVGFRPTVNTIHAEVPLMEVHMLGFDEMIYGRMLDIEFLSRIRGEKRFHGVEELSAQVREDMRRARTVTC